jgi:hypothetical protein
VVVVVMPAMLLAPQHLRRTVFPVLLLLLLPEGPESEGHLWAAQKEACALA